jgi:hypothetical protein
VRVHTVAEPEQRKRAKRQDKTAYTNAVRAVEMTEKFPNQSLKEKDGLLHCEACNTFVSFKEAVDVKQHCFGQQRKGEKSDVVFSSKTEDEKLKLKHYANLVALAAKADHKTLIEEATDQFRKQLFEESKGALSMKGDTLPQEMTTKRVEVHLALLEQGIPITKFADKGFAKLIEQAHLSLGGINGMRAVQPIVRSLVVDRAKAAVAGRLVGITFDGSKVNSSVEARAYSE